MYWVERRSLNLSMMLHALAALVAFVGLPVLLPPAPEPMPLAMTVEVLPITGVTNVAPSDKPIEKKQEAPTPKTPKPVEPSMTEPLKAPEPKPMEKSAPEEKAEPLPADKPKEVPKENPKEEAQKSDDFAALLSKLKQENAAPVKTGKDKTNTEENTTKSDAPYDPTLPMSLSEQDAIRSQFIPCWRVPMGAKDAASLATLVKVELMQDGTVKSAQLDSSQQGRYSNDPTFRAAADAAVRAVHKCSPLKNLPPEKYGTWKQMTINFDPKEML